MRISFAYSAGSRGAAAWVTMFSSFQISQWRDRQVVELRVVVPEFAVDAVAERRFAEEPLPRPALPGGLHRQLQRVGGDPFGRAPDERHHPHPVFGRQFDLPVEARPVGPHHQRALRLDADPEHRQPHAVDPGFPHQFEVLVPERVLRRQPDEPGGRYAPALAGSASSAATTTTIKSRTCRIVIAFKPAAGQSSGSVGHPRRAPPHPLRQSAPLGAWRSLVARTVRVGEVPGSNPGAPMSRRPLQQAGCGLYAVGRSSNRAPICGSAGLDSELFSPGLRTTTRSSIRRKSFVLRVGRDSINEGGGGDRQVSAARSRIPSATGDGGLQPPPLPGHTVIERDRVGESRLDQTQSPGPESPGLLVGGDQQAEMELGDGHGADRRLHLDRDAPVDEDRGVQQNQIGQVVSPPTDRRAPHRNARGRRPSWDREAAQQGQKARTP